MIPINAHPSEPTMVATAKPSQPSQPALAAPSKPKRSLRVRRAALFNLVRAEYEVAAHQRQRQQEFSTIADQARELARQLEDLARTCDGRARGAGANADVILEDLEASLEDFEHADQEVVEAGGRSLHAMGVHSNTCDPLCGSRNYGDDLANVHSFLVRERTSKDEG